MKEEHIPSILGVDFECSTCKKVSQSTAAGRVPVSRIIEKLDSYFEKNDLSSALRHLDYWKNEAQALGDVDGELSVVNEQLGLFRKTNHPQRAEATVARALELLEMTERTDSLSGATILLNAATTLKFLEKAEDAVALYEKVLEIYNRDLEKADLRHAALCNNYATALVDMNRFDKAISLYQKAIALTEAQVESLLDCAITYVNLAHLYEKSEGTESEKIASCLDKAQMLLKDSRIKRNGYYAFVCAKCAPSYDYFGYFLYAQQLTQLSKEIYERN